MRSVLAACALCTACLLTACSGGSPPSAAAGGSSSANGSAGANSGTGGSASASAGASQAAGGTTTDTSPPTSPVEAALRLESALGQHSMLAADMMRARIRGDADLAQAANGALGKNAAEINAVLTPVVPAAAREQFAKTWGLHIQAFFNYARGLSTKDTALQKSTRTDLVAYEGQLAGVFAAQSQGRLDRAAALTAVREHVDHLLQGADSYAAKDYATSAKLYRMSYQHTFDLGGVLARSLLPPAQAKQLDTPAVTLRTSLTKLLGEHVGLVVAAMRSAVGDQRDLAAMGSALDGNTQDLTSAMESLFGAPAAQKFEAQWADHVDALMTYTKATVSHDTAGQQQAQRTLESFEQGFAGYLSKATENRLPKAALAQTFIGVDRTVLAELDAYAAKSFPQAHDLSDQLYSNMFTVSGQLAGAIGATLGSRLPRGGSQAGAGGMAGTVGRR